MSEPKTYAEFFGRDDQDPLGEGAAKAALLTKLYHDWRATSSPYTNTELLEIVLNQFEDTALGGIGVFVSGGDGLHRLQVIHGIRKYPGPIGGTTELAKKLFGYQGDVNIRGVATIAEVTQDLFNITDPVRVYDNAAYKKDLEDNPDKDLIKTLKKDVPNTTAYATRMSMYIPFELMPVLVGKNLTAREAYIAVDTALGELPHRDACEPLLSFLRYSGTLATGDKVNTAHAKICEPFIMEAALDEYMFQRVLCRDLPYYRPKTGQQGGSDLTAMQAALKLLVERESNRNTERSEPRKDSLVDIFGPIPTGKLLGICHKTNTEELPSIYHQLAHRRRNTNELAIVQNAFDQSCTALDLPGRAVVTPAVLQYIKQFQFYGMDGDDLASGVLPMSFVPPGAGTQRGKERLTEDLQQQFGYATMMSTATQLITSSDAMQLLKTKGYIPYKWSEADGQLESYQAVLHCLFGSAHPLYLAYRQGWMYYRTIYIELQNDLDRKLGQRLGPAMLVYLFQAKIRGWLQEQTVHSSRQLPAPDFTYKLRDDYYAGRNLSWLPDMETLPPQLGFLKRVNAAANADVLAQRHAEQEGDGKAKEKKKKDKKNSQERVVNDDVDPRLREDNPMCKNIRTWKITKALQLADGDFPLRTDGKEMCISWRGKGHCYSKCKRAYDHGPSSEEDKETYFGWTKKIYA